MIFSFLSSVAITNTTPEFNTTFAVMSLMNNMMPIMVIMIVLPILMSMFSFLGRGLTSDSDFKYDPVEKTDYTSSDKAFDALEADRISMEQKEEHRRSVAKYYTPEERELMGYGESLAPLAGEIRGQFP